MNVSVCVFLYERPEIPGGLLVHKLHIVQSLPSPRERFLANCSDCILEPKYQTAFVVWSLGMSISEVAGLCNYFGPSRRFRGAAMPPCCHKYF